jgi:hypothetical protein
MWNKPSEKELAALPRLYSTVKIPFDKKIIHMHFFIGRCDWYIAEYSPKKRIFFGFANLGDDQMAEWGYISLDELEEINIGGLEIDRDLWWKPIRFAEITRRVHSYSDG